MKLTLAPRTHSTRIGHKNEVLNGKRKRQGVGKSILISTRNTNVGGHARRVRAIDVNIARGSRTSKRTGRTMTTIRTSNARGSNKLIVPVTKEKAKHLIHDRRHLMCHVTKTIHPTEKLLTTLGVDTRDRRMVGTENLRKKVRMRWIATRRVIMHMQRVENELERRDLQANWRLSRALRDTRKPSKSTSIVVEHELNFAPIADPREQPMNLNEGLST